MQEIIAVTMENTKEGETVATQARLQSISDGIQLFFQKGKKPRHYTNETFARLPPRTEMDDDIEIDSRKMLRQNMKRVVTAWRKLLWGDAIGGKPPKYHSGAAARVCCEMSVFVLSQCVCRRKQHHQARSYILRNCKRRKTVDCRLLRE